MLTVYQTTKLLPMTKLSQATLQVAMCFFNPDNRCVTTVTARGGRQNFYIADLDYSS